MVLIISFLLISFLWGISGFCSNNHNTRISQRIGILVHHCHHMRDPCSWLGHVDLFQVQHRLQKSQIPRSSKSPKSLPSKWKTRVTRWTETDGELQRNQETRQVSLVAAISVVSPSAQTQILQTCLPYVTFNTFMSGHDQRHSYLAILKGLCTLRLGLPTVLDMILTHLCEVRSSW